MNHENTGQLKKPSHGYSNKDLTINSRYLTDNLEQTDLIS
jgi:hypothetical protein